MAWEEAASSEAMMGSVMGDAELVDVWVGGSGLGSLEGSGTVDAALRCRGCR